jgi:hypothetical protein
VAIIFSKRTLFYGIRNIDGCFILFIYMLMVLLLVSGHIQFASSAFRALVVTWVKTGTK